MSVELTTFTVKDLGTIFGLGAGFVLFFGVGFAVGFAFLRCEIAVPKKTLSNTISAIVALLIFIHFGVLLIRVESQFAS